MVISSDYSLIPYAGQNYQVQAFHQENSLMRHHPGQDKIGRNHLFRQPHHETATRINPFFYSAGCYDASQSLVYCDEHNVGRLVNIYA